MSEIKLNTVLLKTRCGCMKLIKDARSVQEIKKYGLLVPLTPNAADGVAPPDVSISTEKPANYREFRYKGPKRGRDSTLILGEV